MGKIRFYFAKEGAQWFPHKTCFHPYSQYLQLSNETHPGEITGRGFRVWNRGDNTNDLAGDHFEGTPADFIGQGVPPP